MRRVAARRATLLLLPRVVVQLRQSNFLPGVIAGRNGRLDLLALSRVVVRVPQRLLGGGVAERDHFEQPDERRPQVDERAERPDVAPDTLYVQMTPAGAEAGADVLAYANAPSDVSDSLGRFLGAFQGFPLTS